MAAEILSESDDEIAIKVVIKKSARFLECEEQIRDALNDAGTLATERCLENFDADGSPIVVAGRTLSAKRCKVPQKYHTPYGVVCVPRYVYQSSSGGATYCPLDNDARIIDTSTPRFAQIVSSKYGMLNSSKVQTDLLEDSRIVRAHRSISRRSPGGRRTSRARCGLRALAAMMRGASTGADARRRRPG